MNAVRLVLQLIVAYVAVTFSLCRTQGAANSKFPPEIAINQTAGRGDLLFVTVRMEPQQEVRLIVDTGAPATLLDKSFEAKLGKKVATRKIQWSGGKLALDAFPAPKLYLGNTQLLTAREIMTFDFKQLNYPGSPIMGVLGVDCLRHYCIQLDFTANKMRFLDPEDLDSQSLGQAFPLDFSRGCFEIRDNLLGTGRANSLIDTGCNFDGVLIPTLFRQWTNILVVPPKQQARFPNGVLGGVRYPKLNLHGDGGNNLLGLSLLARHLVTFNFPKRIMYLKRVTDGPLENDYSFTNSLQTIRSPAHENK